MISRASWIVLCMLFCILLVFSVGCESDEENNADGDHDLLTDGDGEEDSIEKEVEQEAPAKAVYIILTTEALQNVANEYSAYRQSKGFAVEVHTSTEINGSGEADLIQNIHALLEKKANEEQTAPNYLLILSDGAGSDENAESFINPLDCENMLGECYTDNTFADLTGDGIPDVAVGRVAARTAEEARGYLEKIKDYEANYPVGIFNRRINLYAGEPGFGPQIDGMLEMAVFQALETLDHAFDIVGTYASPTSPYFYRPFEDKVRDVFNEGSIITLYIGHGTSDWTEGLDMDGLENIHCTNRKPVSFLFACSNGEFRGQVPCIAEALMLKSDGPIATFAASGVSHPYGNAILPYEIQRALLDQKPETVGEAIMLAKRYSIENNDKFRRLIDSSADASGEVPKADQPVIMRQHLDLYNFFGDPALVIRYPERIDFKPGITTGSLAEGTLTVEGQAPGLGNGTAQVSLEVKRDKLVNALETVDDDDASQSMTDKIQSNWLKATNKNVAAVSVEMKDGVFKATMNFPTEVVSYPSQNPVKSFYLKVYASDGSKDAFGSLDLNKE